MRHALWLLLMASVVVVYAYLAVAVLDAMFGPAAELIGRAAIALTG